MSRRSPTYESRLIKYAKRNFAIAVPGLLLANVDWGRLPSNKNCCKVHIKCQIAKLAAAFTGLTKLLVHHSTQGYYFDGTPGYCESLHRSSKANQVPYQLIKTLTI
jgi:hypothetical protein